MKHNVKITVCRNGLGEDEPVMPVSSCKNSQCEWRVNSSKHHNCLWVLAAQLQDEGERLSLRGCASYLMENYEKIREIEAKGLRKLFLGLESIEKGTFKEAQSPGVRTPVKKKTNNSILQKMKDAARRKNSSRRKLIDLIQEAIDGKE